MNSSSTFKAGILVAFALLMLMLISLATIVHFAFSQGEMTLTNIWQTLAQAWQDPYYRHVTRFSLSQAFWSTLLSLGLAIPLAHALFHSNFKGKKLLLSLFSTTLVLPVLVGVFGVLAILGNSGWLAKILAQFDLEMPFSIYGLSGILVAHVFFNLPYASRLLLQALEATPIEQRQLCQHLGMNHWQAFRLVEWPRLRAVLPALVGFVFLLCFTSFSVVMTLGGGPKSATLEVIIYQAIKFDFDFTTGAIFALWQMLICVVIGLVVMRASQHLPSAHGRLYSEHIQRWHSRRFKCWQSVWIIAATVFVLLPLLATVWQGLNGELWRILTGAIFWRALLTSIAIALCAAGLALVWGSLLLRTSLHWRLKQYIKRADTLEWIGNLILITPAIVISTGLFLALRNYVHITVVSWLVVVMINSVMALPYVLHTLSRPMQHTAEQYQYLCASLGLQGFQRVYWLQWRALKAIFIRAFVVSVMVSMGDLSAIALFGDQSLITLPLYLYQLLGSYQMEQAAVVSLALLMFTLSIFAWMESRQHNNKRVNNEFNANHD